MSEFSVEEIANKLRTVLISNHEHTDDEGILHKIENFVEVFCTEKGDKITDQAKALISIVCRLSYTKRLAVAQQYNRKFKRDLVMDLNEELSGNFGKLMVGLMQPLLSYRVHAMHEAIKGLGTDELALIDILCTASPYEIEALTKEYKEVHDRCLDDEIKDETSGDFQVLLKALMSAKRNKTSDQNTQEALESATILHKNLMSASAFIPVLAENNFFQLRLISLEYEKKYKTKLADDIRANFVGDLQDAFYAIVKHNDDPAEYFAERLYDSMKGMGTNDAALVRIFVTRCTIMDMIKVKFEKLYMESLESWIKDDTSGAYMMLLLGIVNPNSLDL